MRLTGSSDVLVQHQKKCEKFLQTSRDCAVEGKLESSSGPDARVINVPSPKQNVIPRNLAVAVAQGR